MPVIPAGRDTEHRPRSRVVGLCEPTDRSRPEIGYDRQAMPAVASVIHSDPEILSGAPVFVGTRVPLQNLVDYLAAGESLEKFLDAFPSVTHEQATTALALAGEALAERARPH